MRYVCLEDGIVLLRTTHILETSRVTIYGFVSGRAMHGRSARTTPTKCPDRGRRSRLNQSIFVFRAEASLTFCRRVVLNSRNETMKTRLLLALIGLAIGFILPTFAQEKDTVDPRVAEQVRALAAKYDEAFNRNDAVAVAALYTEDAVFETPSGAFHGREAIEE